MNATRSILVLTLGSILSACAGEGLDDQGDEPTNATEAVIEGCTLQAYTPFRWSGEPSTIYSIGELRCNHPVNGYFLKVCVQMEGANGWRDEACQSFSHFSTNVAALGVSTDPPHGQHSFRTRVYATNSASIARKVSDATTLGF
jgi:hypothetical protein